MGTLSTRSDTETIVHLYEEEGEQCVEKLRGCLCSRSGINTNINCLSLATGWARAVALYVGSPTLIFGSEIKALLQHPCGQARS